MGHSKGADGLYHINGRIFKKLVGTRAEVIHGTAYKTSGGLKSTDLIKNKNGRIVSKKKHNYEKKTKRLLKYGYTAEKGKFGAVRVGSRKHRGGLSMPSMTGMKGSLSSGLSKLNGAMLTKKGGYAPPNASYSNYNEQPPMISGSGITAPEQRALYAAAGGYRQTRSAKGRGKRYRGGYSGPLAPMTPLSQANLGFSNYVTPERFTPETRALMSVGGKGRTRGKYRGGYSGPLAPMTPLSQANLGFSNYVTPERFTPETNALMAGL